MFCTEIQLFHVSILGIRRKNRRQLSKFGIIVQELLMKNLNNMLLFAQVAELGSFVAAARELGIPTSTLSRRVAELEAEVGVKLLLRTTRKVALTKIGELFYQHCAPLREVAQAAEDAVSIARNEPTGTIRFSCPVSLAQTTVRPILPEFMRRYPKIAIDMIVSNAAFDPIQSGLDVALRIRPTLDDSGSLVIKQFGMVVTQLLASPGLLNDVGAPRSPEHLKGMPSVAMSAIDGRATLRLKGPGDSIFEMTHRPKLAADDFHILKSVMMKGFGMGVLPVYLCAEELARGQLVEVLPGWAPVSGILHAVFPSRRGMLPAVRCFLDFLDEHVREGIFRL